MAYFDIFTNMKVSDNWLLAREFKFEVLSGCLVGSSVDCSLLEVGRELSRRINVLRNLGRTDASSAVCDGFGK
jgi:hypothetical protein